MKKKTPKKTPKTKKKIPKIEKKPVTKSVQKTEISDDGKFKFSEKQTIAFDDFTSQKRELCYDGGARSGKTYFVIYCIVTRAILYPESRHLIARFRLNHMTLTVWMQTLLPILKLYLPENAYSIDNQLKIVTLYNGSVIMGAGLDDKDRVEKIMGSEYSTIFINEATQVSYDTYQKIKTRLSGQAINPTNGREIKRKIILDCNPRSESHWIYQNFIIGKDPKSKEPLSSNSRENMIRRNWIPYDNPFLPSDYLEILENLTGAERQRLLEGKWVNKEGLVYPNFEDCIIDPIPIPEQWEVFGAVDFGYTNPFVFLFIAYDKSNEIYYLYDEHYSPSKTVREHSKIIKSRGVKKFSKILADHDAEDRATLLEEGLHTFPANKDVSAGIQALNLMINAEMGVKLKIFNSCVETIDEMSTYCWQEPSEGKNFKEEPIKFRDHACDALRYFAIDRVGSGFNKVKVSSVKVSKTGVMTREQVMRKRYDKLGLDYDLVARDL